MTASPDLSILHLPEETSFQAVIFDCDGTLVDSLPAHISALEHALRPYGLHIEADWCRAHSGQSPATVLQAYEREIALLPVAHDAVLQAYLQGFQQSLDLLAEIPAVAELARCWHGRLPLAVASNGRRPNVIATLESTGLLPLFDFVITIEDVDHGKPAPDLFLEAAHRMQRRPELCLVLEDSAEGMTAAERAGMQAVLVAPPHGR